MDNNDIRIFVDGLIPVYSNSYAKLVNAQDLHICLSLRSDFLKWIKNRISNFPEGVIVKKSYTYSGKSYIEYYVSLHDAKAIARVKNNDAGNQLCEYLYGLEID